MLSEEKIVDEAHYLREVFDKFQGKPFDTTQPVNYAVSSIISAIVYGKRFEYEDPKFQVMEDKANKNICMLGSVVIQESGEKESHFHEQNLLITVSNLFAAGTDTTGTTVRWGLMLMAKYPHTQ
ncbi:hypothetical protein cypCar_00040790, partial [Cyprinus carpio]